MAAIRDVATIAQTWADVTPQRAPQYEAGVKAPLRDWKASTLAAADAWKTGVTRAVADGSFTKGVNRVGTAGWQEGAVTKGPSRGSQGVTLARPKYEKAFAPYVAAIKALVLPPRFARRSPQNMARVQAVVDAMIKTKVGLGGG